MESETDPLDQPVTERFLTRLGRSGVLAESTLTDALKLVGITPDRERWRRFLDVLSLIFATGFTVSGIFFFFAFNWSSLPGFAKLGLIQAAVVIAAGLAFYFGLDKLNGKIALLAAGLLIGAAFGVLGQVYQTGADSYLLFMWWVLLMAGWVWISRFTPMWVAWVTLINILIILFFVQVGSQDRPSFIFLAIFGVNILAVVVWEVASDRGVAWLQSRWAPRVVAIPAFLATIIPTMVLIDSPGEAEGDPLLWALPVLFVILSGAVLFVYSQSIRDLFMLTLCAFGLILVIDFWIATVLLEGDFSGLILSVLLIVEVAAVATWFRRLSRQWEGVTA